LKRYPSLSKGFDEDWKRRRLRKIARMQPKIRRDESERNEREEWNERDMGDVY
jgi:hypothetical protein